MNIQDISTSLILETGGAYASSGTDKSTFATLCAHKAIEWLEVNQARIEAVVHAVSSDKSKTRKQERKKYRETYREVRAYVEANVDFAPQGFIFSIFFSFIAPMIINWVASKLMELLFGT